MQSYSGIYFKNQVVQKCLQRKLWGYVKGGLLKEFPRPNLEHFKQINKVVFTQRIKSILMNPYKLI
jgi:hypothetical protein